MTAAVHIVDDDEAIRDSLAWLFRSRGIEAIAWASGEQFLADYRPGLVGCLVLDIRMEGLSGIEVFERLGRDRGRQPVIFLTGHGDIPLAVECLKQGAADFLEKPFNDNDLVDRVLAALDRARDLRRDADLRDAFGARLASLSPREREVLDMMVGGLLNKQIADRLAITMRTVEVHRARVLEKMGARNAVDLARQMAVLAPPSGPSARV